MANSKISDLPAAVALTGVEVLPVVQSGETVKGSVQQLATAITGATGTNGETVTTSKPRLDLTQTWNNVATTFTGIKLNVTDTASEAGSLLMDLQVGGASKFSVNKSGVTTVSNRDGSSTYIKLTSDDASCNFGFKILNGNTSTILNEGTGVFHFLPGGGLTGLSVMGTTGTRVGSTAYFAWTSGNSYNGVVDVSLFRDAAGTLAQRNGVNAQTFRLYNTFTDASNYERGFMRWNSNVLEIGAEAGGTGTQRIVNILTSTSNKIVFTGTSIGYAYSTESVRASINLNGKNDGGIVLIPRPGIAPDVTVGLTRAGSFGFNWDRSSATNVTHLITAYRSYVGSYTGPGDNISLKGGDAAHPSTTFAGGNIFVRGGAGVNGGANGLVIMDTLPTSSAGLPTGALWNNLGVLSIA